MTRYSFILLSADKEDFLQRLSSLGLMDISRSGKPVDGHSEELLSRIESAKAEIRTIQSGTDPHLEELRARRGELAQECEALSVWGEYDRAKLAETGVRIRFYCEQEKKFDAAWEEHYPVEVIEHNGGKVWFVVLGDCDFPVKELPEPRCTAETAEAELRALDEEIDAYRKHLQDRQSEIPSMEALVKDTHSELDRYLASITSEDAAEGRLSVFEGFAPAESRDAISSELDRMDCYWSAEDATTEDKPPIKLKNNRYVSMFEVLTDMYGRPSYDGFDPTPFISIFFLLFFAFCMGDAGYGIILVILGFVLKKVKSFAKLSPLVVTLGVATIVVGFLFHTFFSCDMASWKCIPDWVKCCFLPSKIMGYDGTMVLSIIVGIIHISLAMIVKTIMATRNKGFLNSLGTWGWTLLIVGGVVTGLFALIGVLDKEVTKWVIIAIGCISAVGIFLLNDLHRNPLLNIGSGLWETYNTVTGLLGDVLSYLRLYALGLAGSMLGMAFNQIGMMIAGDGGSALLWIPAVLVFIVGHTLNIAMAMLGAFVHPLRLNFLEFFKNSGYEGNGRNYNPLQK